MIVGYSNVSTDGQTLDAQQAALRDTEVVDTFAPPRDGFLAEASSTRHGRRLRCTHVGRRARESMRFTVPSLRPLWGLF
jgi:DNA invertase Pin-like site-specific DNA recombinase